jgi:hypothetical protein
MKAATPLARAQGLGRLPGGVPRRQNGLVVGHVLEKGAAQCRVADFLGVLVEQAPGRVENLAGARRRKPAR